MLSYSLIENTFDKNSRNYSARTQSNASADKETIINRMLNSGTTLTRTDILAVFNCMEETIANTLLAGENINLPLFNTSFSITGVFNNSTDSFDKNRHRFHIKVTRGKLLRDIEKKVVLEKTYSPSRIPQILEIKDCVSSKINKKLTPGGVVDIYGSHLKIIGDNTDCGIWFIHEGGTEIKAKHLIDNKPSRLCVLIPELMNGIYKIKVISQFSGGGNLTKTPKVYISQKELRVENIS